jgi:serine/threonine-protein kinase RsbW
LSTTHLELAGTADQLSVLMQFAQNFRRDEALSDGDAFALELVLEELFMNVAMHGSAGRAAPPGVVVTLATTGPELLIVLEDDGTPFDPLTAPPPDITASLDERPIGGLGLYLIQELMDHVDYQLVNGRNRIQLRKTLTP